MAFPVSLPDDGFVDLSVMPVVSLATTLVPRNTTYIFTHSDISRRHGRLSLRSRDRRRILATKGRCTADSMSIKPFLR